MFHFVAHNSLWTEPANSLYGPRTQSNSKRSIFSDLSTVLKMVQIYLSLLLRISNRLRRRTPFRHGVVPGSDTWQMNTSIALLSPYKVSSSWRIVVYSQNWNSLMCMKFALFCMYILFNILSTVLQLNISVWSAFIHVLLLNNALVSFGTVYPSHFEHDICIHNIWYVIPQDMNRYALHSTD